MNTFKISIKFGAALLFALGTGTGCETTDSGSTHHYYGAGYQNPWYYGTYDDRDNVIITPPTSGNPPDNGVRPTHPIAGPPASRPPRPSIPTAPRPAPRPAMRR